ASSCALTFAARICGLAVLDDVPCRGEIATTSVAEIVIVPCVSPPGGTPPTTSEIPASNDSAIRRTSRTRALSSSPGPCGTVPGCQRAHPPPAPGEEPASGAAQGVTTPCPGVPATG